MQTFAHSIQVMKRIALACFLGAYVVSLTSAAGPMSAFVPAIRPTANQASSAVGGERVRSIADDYVRAYTDAFPERAELAGLSGASHLVFSDYSASARLVWERREDAWLAQLRAIDGAALVGTQEWVTYGQLRERLEASVGLRICRAPLWNVNQMEGWQVSLPRVVQLQPVGTTGARQDAVSRWRTFPRYIDTEIANLRDGLQRGYSSPRRNVQLVIAQLDALLAMPENTSPFFSPATRDTDGDFRASWAAVVREAIAPTITRYRGFLATEYVPKARDAMGLAANPDGAACYGASFRSYTTISREPSETVRLGEARVAENERVARRNALEKFGTDDLNALAVRMAADTTQRFASRDAMQSFAQDAVARGARMSLALFSHLPRATVVVEPFPAYLEATASDQYSAAPRDGSRPAAYRINLSHAEEKTRFDAESTVYHETYPGHHLQIGIGGELPSGHPIGLLTGNAAFAEGWARYAETLAEENGFYVESYAPIARRRWPGRGMVVDPGVHLYGWTRARAIDYMVAGNLSRSEAEILLDRVAVSPAQLTAYDTGGLEFFALRDEARRVLGNRFDLRQFHEQVLGYGRIPLPMLRSSVERWLAKEAAR